MTCLHMAASLLTSRKSAAITHATCNDTLRNAREVTENPGLNLNWVCEVSKSSGKEIGEYTFHLWYKWKGSSGQTQGPLPCARCLRERVG